jgi:hypothetical protein
MIRAFYLLAAVTIIIAWTSSDVYAQKSKKQCSFKQCYSNCLTKGGAGRHTPEIGCQRRCSNRGCT